MQAPLNSNQFTHLDPNQTIGKLSETSKELTVKDLADIDKKIASNKLLGKTLATVSLFTQGKGKLSWLGLRNLIYESPQKDTLIAHLIKNFPEINKWLRIEELANLMKGSTKTEPPKIKLTSSTSPAVQETIKTYSTEVTRARKANPKKETPWIQTTAQTSPSKTIKISQSRISSNPLQNIVKEKITPQPPPTTINQNPTTSVKPKTEEQKKLDKAWNELNEKTKAFEKQAFLSETGSADKMPVEHRSMNVKCPENTAVEIKKHSHGEKKLFLHANRVGKGVESNTEFIATQYPKSSDHKNFWQMAHENSHLIIDLSTPGDLNLNGIFNPYSPTAQNPLDLENELKVVLKKDETIGKSKVYTYDVTPNGESGKQVSRIHFDKWQDRDVISAKDLKELVDLCNSHLLPGSSPIVHCIRGAGRTGTLITAMIIHEKVQSGEIKQGDDPEKIFNIILKGREARGGVFVQTPDQFNLLHEFTQLLLQ